MSASRIGCTVEILSVGNELLLGNTANTNATWIATKVTQVGGKVIRITTVGDNLCDISRSVREALRRKPDFLITTGGIGPTFDDMTLSGVAAALRLQLKLNRQAVAMIQDHYVRRFPSSRIKLNKPRLKMAFIPTTSTPIRNPIGTAPAVMLSARSTEIYCLPGVPSEAKAIFRETVSKIVGAKASGAVFLERWLKVKGIMESTLAPIIDRVMRNWPGVYIKSHPRGVEAGGRPNIELHFSMSSEELHNARRSVIGAVDAMTRELKNRQARVADEGT